MFRTMLFAAVVVLAGCTTPPKPAVIAAPLASDNRNCATITKELEQVSYDLKKIEPDAEASAAKNKEIRESLMSKILLFHYLEYDAETVEKYDALKKRKELLELTLTEKECAAKS